MQKITKERILKAIKEQDWNMMHGLLTALLFEDIINKEEYNFYYNLYEKENEKWKII